MLKPLRHVTIHTRVFWFSFLSVFIGLSRAQEPIIYKANKIYLCDTSFRVVEAMVVKGDRILLTGTLDSARRLFPGAKTVNYGKKCIYPGFIDAHCHFYGYAKGLGECNLVGTKSAEDVVARVKVYAKTNQSSWIVGRGWDQNDWPGGNYPDMSLLDAAFPNTPVVLKRIDGHAAWINSAAMKAAKLNPANNPAGGEYLKVDGRFTGILIDNAVELVTSFIPAQPEALKKSNIQKAAALCQAAGLTTVDDAGLEPEEISYLDSLQKKHQLNLRIYAMVNGNMNGFAWVARNGVYQTPMMHVGAMKFYLDGALGSRGALLKKDYCDRPGHRGLLLLNPTEFLGSCQYLFSVGYQVCVHAIGDSANKIALKTFKTIIPQGTDVRWRIEHAQIMDPADIPMYREISAIPSIQPTHATSDAPWVESRLCASRMAGAYAYETIRRSSAILALGTDFPVEDISPIRTFYSATTRLDFAGKLKEPFIPRQALDRKAALLGMTIWAAIANFEEREKGSLETGKYADFVVLDKDLMTAEDAKIKKTKVIATFIGGEKVFGK